MAVRLTRPEYLLKFLQYDLDLETLKKVFPEDYGLIYCSYNTLQKLRLEHDIEIRPEDIISAESNLESMSVSIEFTKKTLAKQVKDSGVDFIRGVRDYGANIILKGKGSSVFFTFEFVNDEESKD